MEIENLTTEQKVVVFKVNGKNYCLPTKYVTAIEKPVHITRVPNVPPFIKGVINLRGVIVPIIDLKKRFNIDDSQLTENTRIIILVYNEMTIGIIVDEANDVIDLPEDAIEPKPNVAGTVDEEFIYGIANFDNRLLILLDIHEILKLPTGNVSL